MRYIVILLLLAGFISCSKTDKQQNKENASKNQGEEMENPGDTAMTVEERFSSSILTDFLDDTDDEDLSDYLENELFKYSKDYRGASLLQISNSLWYVTLEDQNSTKSFLLQKFVDFNTNDYYFRLTETPLNVSDIIINSNLSRNSNTLKKIGTLTKEQNK